MVKKQISQAHQNLLNTLSGKIARIYNSDDLDNNLKHDIVCRLIAKSIGANSASLLLYRGTTDNLFCAGKYIDPRLAEAVSTTGLYGEEVVRVMQRIDVLQYLRINKVKVELKGLDKYFLYKQYEEFCVFDFSNPVKISREEFVSFLRYYAQPDLKRIVNRHYENYIAHIRNDIHRISIAEPVTGAYYYALTHSRRLNEFYSILQSSPNIQGDDYKAIVADLNFFGKSVCKDNLFKKLGVNISSNALYVGIPLLANDRPIGILRLLLKRSNSFEIPIIDEKEENEIVRFEFDEEHEALKYVRKTISIETLTLLLSLFIENLFFADGMRDISLKDALKGDISNLAGIADELTKVVNCHGCMIRLSDAKGNNCAIQGFSKELAPYVKAVTKDDPFITAERKFVPVLIDLLYKNNTAKVSDENFKRIECVKIDFNETGSPNFSLLYLDEKSRLVSTSMEGFLNNRERKELTENFYIKGKTILDFDFRTIILIPIKDQEFGFVTFANKSNRRFIVKDIEMLIPVVNRLSLALKYDSSIAKAHIASIDQIQQSQRVIYHQLLSPIANMNNSLLNLQLLSQRKDYGDFDNRIEEIFNILKTTRDYISLNQYLATFLIDKKVKLKAQKVVLYNFLKEKVRSYQVYAKAHRNLALVIFDEERIKSIPAFNTDISLLSHIIQALLDNAIKYSYSHLEFGQYRDYRNPLYPPLNSNIPKAILISVSFIQNILTISIENWGCKIKDNDKKAILEYMQRGEESQYFEINGTGIGLFLANILAVALNGELIIEPQGDHTTIHLKLNIKAM